MSMGFINPKIAALLSPNRRLINHRRMKGTEEAPGSPSRGITFSKSSSRNPDAVEESLTTEAE